MNKYAKDYDIIVKDFAPWNPLFSRYFHNKIVLQLHHREGLNILRKYLIAGLPFYLIEKYYPSKFRNIISVSEETAYKFNLHRVKVIANGISEDLLNVEVKDGDYLAFVGRIDIYNKGLDLLLRAIKELEIKSLIAGKGKHALKLKKMIKELNLSHKVEYLGYLSQSEKIALISNAKFVLMPSRFEGQGIVALEVAAMGKPLIVSDIPELRYVTKNGFGMGFRSGDADSLREAIKYLLKNDLLVKEMGKVGRKYASHFSWDRIAQEYEDYLFRVMEEET